VGYRYLPSKVDAFLAYRPETRDVFKRVLADGYLVEGSTLVDEHFDPMISWLYSGIRDEVGAESLTVEGAAFFVKELSVFARYNSQFLKRAAESVSEFVPELAFELLRNHLEEGGERGKLPSHFVIYSGALLKDLDLMVNGYVPQAETTRTLVWLHDTIVNSHCPSTILGMYYATEAVATAETVQLQQITNRLGQLLRRGTGSELKALDFYYRMHLDNAHEASSGGVAVETGHQEGIARFIRNYSLYHFDCPRVVDGFLQMLGPLVDQWTELCSIGAGSQGNQMHKVSLV
jgi:hypothetical protein